MSGYYEILGVSKSATNDEIKAAFRRLAKQYHPDKNPSPNAKAIFEKILKAYNVLINSHSRKRYDEGFFSPPINTLNKRKAGEGKNKTKEWSFTEEELKRRQYYQTYYKTKQREKQETIPKQTYSDYKYILFATPLAVALLMFIVSFFSEEPNLQTIQSTPDKLETVEKNVSIINNGDTPYYGFFGNSKTFDTKYELKINNKTNYDAVIVLFDFESNKYIQHAYLKDSYYLKFSFLPKSGVYMKAIIGNDWNKNVILFNNKINGNFDSLIQYQNWKLKPIIFDNEKAELEKDLYIIDANSKDKKYISNDIDFFTK